MGHLTPGQELFALLLHEGPKLLFLDSASKVVAAGSVVRHEVCVLQGKPNVIHEFALQLGTGFYPVVCVGAVG